MEDLKKLFEEQEIENKNNKIKLIPFVPKEKYWNKLEDNVNIHENNDKITNGSKWISLRLDGRSFSTLGFKNYSVDFENRMIETCKELIVYMNASFGFTQSDEITIVINPRNKKNSEEYFEHNFNGRILKLCSLSSSYTSVIFNKEPKVVQKDCVFDCRIGIYDTYEDLIKILKYRSYSCYINALGDILYFNGYKKFMGLNSKEKIDKILELNLDIRKHQLYGTCFIIEKCEREGYNPKTKKTSIVSRKILKELDVFLVNYLHLYSLNFV